MYCFFSYVCLISETWKVIKLTVYLFNRKRIKSAVIVMQCSGISHNFPMTSEVTWCVGNGSNQNKKYIKLEQKMYQICIKLENASSIIFFIFPMFLKLFGVSDNYSFIY